MYIPTYDTLISKLESILRYIHTCYSVIHFWKWETKSDMTVKSQIFVCGDGICMVYRLITEESIRDVQVVVTDH